MLEPTKPSTPSKPSEPTKRGKLVLSANAAWNIANFRGGLIRALQSDGWDVVAAAPADEHVAAIEALGCRFVDLPMDNGNTNPVADLRLLRDYRRLFERERPAAFLGFTIKPNVYGSMAAHRLGVPVVNNIAGLGATFINRSWVTHVVRFLYRRALSRSHRVLFQNDDDRALFVSMGLVDAAHSERVPGSGIDLSRFTADAPLPSSTRLDKPGLNFLLIARMLKDKGVFEYAEAARTLARERPAVRCSLLGYVDVRNPSAISAAHMQSWVDEGVVRFLGDTNDVRPFIADADCVVLPSYREGVPRTLLEAAAMARPIITTDAPGCKDVVDEGVNGYKVPVADAQALAEAMKRMADLPRERLEAMGRASRAKAEREFDEHLVTDTYVQILSSLHGG